jgi:phytoene/squalene synthetase
VRDATAALAHSITWAGSKQTYYTARLMVDRDLVDDFYRAYAYFRWTDDVIDVSSRSHDERVSFIRRQRALIEGLYRGNQPDGLMPEEKMIADLIGHNEEQNCRLESFVRNMFAIIEFDAYRKGQVISQQELTWYSDCLGKAVVDGLQHFIGNGHPYPATSNRYLAAIAAHIAHLLRDMLLDTGDGFINIPREYLQAHAISPEDVGSPPFRAWVRSRVDQAREFFREGKRYLDDLDVLRCKIVAHWYCARFEGVLDAIEQDRYILRAVYNERHKLPTVLRIVWLAVSVTFQHLARRGLRHS